ncbi:MAG: hypothetical protein AMXMBFR84_12310 [Candidatus Hydrogenedentota bacterium]
MPVLGMVEFAGIAAGIRASDAMVKAAPVELIESRPTTPGKYISLVTGDVASVEASVRAGIHAAGDASVLDSFVLANLHEQVLPSIRGTQSMPELDALGVLESTTAASIIKAADAACKAAPVTLVRLHLAMHIGGKGYVTFVGSVADVGAALEAGRRAASDQWLDEALIPNPYAEIWEHLKRTLDW